MDNSSIVTAYKKAKRRLLLLDYDGTLAPIMPTPELAAPSAEVRDLLKKLAAQPSTTCVIISGRPHEVLEEWLGDLPVAFVAEHGLAWREKDGVWEWNEDLQTDWKEEVRKVFRRYVERMPGALIEEKMATIAFHYRNVDGFVREEKLNELNDELQSILHNHLLKLIKGKMVYEVIMNGASKGVAASAWYGRELWDFALAMGDDTTDEAMFEDLPSEVCTVKVGLEPTAARYKVGSQIEATQLLHELTVS